MKIRKATLKDIDELRKLYFEFLKEDNDGTFDANWAYTERSKVLLEEPIQKAEGFVFVCEDKGRLIGFIIGWKLEGKESRKGVSPARIDEVFVTKNYRSQGMGKKFIKEFEKWAKTKGANKLKVGSYFDNEIARNLYKELGFDEWVVEFEKDI